MKKDSFPIRPRYDYCVECACSFLEAYEIDNYPLDLYDIIKKSPYDLVRYSDIMIEYNLSLADTCKIVKSPDGQTILEDGIFTIFLNDVNISLGRMLFTLAHEIGHIWLGHLLDFDITAIPHNSSGPNMPRYKYNILEREANVFARNVLAPLSIFYKLDNKSHFNLQQLFGLSWDAADMRINFIDYDYKSSKNLKLANRFLKISDSYFYKRRCAICGYGFSYPHSNYCPICGNNFIEWGNGDKMKYKNHEIDENGRLKKCIKCDNEALVGGYCHICGSPVENYCTDSIAFHEAGDCTNVDPLPANARYCPICGCESLFNRRGVLIDWSQELRQIEEAQHDTESLFMNIPDGIDEELPFSDDEFLPFN